MLPQGRRLIQMQAPQQLRPHHLHLAVGLDQQAAITGQPLESPLPQQFTVGPLGRGALGH